MKPATRAFVIAALERELAQAEGTASITDLVAAEAARAYERSAPGSPFRVIAHKLAADALHVHGHVEDQVVGIRRRLEDARAEA